MTQYISSPPVNLYPPQRKPVWPLVIGIISTSLGGLTLLCGAGGMIVGQAVQSMFTSFPGPRGTSMPGFNPSEFMESIPPWIHMAQIAMQLANLATAALLLVAGILLIKRRPAGYVMHILYAVIDIIVVLGGAYVSYLVLTAMQDWFARNGPEQAMPMMKSMFAAQSVLGVVMNLALGLAYPVFVLVWFARSKISRQVRQWGRPEGAPLQ